MVTFDRSRMDSAHVLSFPRNWDGLRLFAFWVASRSAQHGDDECRTHPMTHHIADENPVAVFGQWDHFVKISGQSRDWQIAGAESQAVCQVAAWRGNCSWKAPAGSPARVAAPPRRCLFLLRSSFARSVAWRWAPPPTQVTSLETPKVPLIVPLLSLQGNFEVTT